MRIHCIHRIFQQINDKALYQKLLPAFSTANFLFSPTRLNLPPVIKWQLSNMLQLFVISGNKNEISQWDGKVLSLKKMKESVWYMNVNEGDAFHWKCNLCRKWYWIGCIGFFQLGKLRFKMNFACIVYSRISSASLPECQIFYSNIL